MQGSLKEWAMINIKFFAKLINFNSGQYNTVNMFRRVAFPVRVTARAQLQIPTSLILS